jgi:hypothetical protein
MRLLVGFLLLLAVLGYIQSERNDCSFAMDAADWAECLTR